MKISIIVPIYNVSKYIDRGMEQLLSIDFPDYEIILVDDGSTDGSGSMVDKWAKDNQKVSVFHQENQGAGAARNLGIKHAKGEYLWFFDIDDMLESKVLNVCSRELLRHHCPDMLCFGYDTWDEEYKIKTECRFASADYQSNDEVRDNFYDNLLGIKFNNGFVWNKIYRKDFVLANKIKFPDLKIQQDEVFNLRCYEHVQHLVCITDILYHYFIYYKGNTRSYYFPDRINIFLQVRDAFLKLFDFWGLNNKNVRQYAHKRYVNAVISALKYYYKIGKFDCNSIRKVMESEDLNESLSQIDATAKTPYMKAVENRSVNIFIIYYQKECIIEFFKSIIRSIIKMVNVKS